MFSGSNRNLLASRYSELRSTAIHFRLSISHASPVVLLHAKGSMTRSPVSVRKRMKKRGSRTGKRAGWGLWPVFLHLSR